MPELRLAVPWHALRRTAAWGCTAWRALPVAFSQRTRSILLAVFFSVLGPYHPHTVTQSNYYITYVHL